tara:strand:- start:52513 stop:52860 length:348 start_codon:yes stop_codon:yes gene_type:complete
MTCKKSTLIRNNKPLCELWIADTALARMKGLLGSKPLADKQGLLMSPCNSIHTLGMKYGLDVVFLNKAGKVKKISRTVKPNRMKTCFSAAYVIELKAGQASALGIEKSQILTWML